MRTSYPSAVTMEAVLYPWERTASTDTLLSPLPRLTVSFPVVTTVPFSFLVLEASAIPVAVKESFPVPVVTSVTATPLLWLRVTSLLPSPTLISVLVSVPPAVTETVSSPEPALTSASILPMLLTMATVLSPSPISASTVFVKLSPLPSGPYWVSTFKVSSPAPPLTVSVLSCSSIRTSIPSSPLVP